MDPDAPSSPDQDKAPEQQPVRQASDSAQELRRDTQGGVSGLGKFWAELKRRKVVRVAIVYAVVAWSLIEISDTVFPKFNIPAWGETFVILLLAIGFPIALIFAWAFQLTAEGIKADSGVQLSQATTTATSTDRKLIYAVLGLVLLIAGFQVADRFVFNDPQSAIQLPATTDSRQISDVIRFTIPIGEDVENYLGSRGASGSGRPVATSLALSNSGNLLVYSASKRGSDGQENSQLYLKRLDQERALSINGTEGAIGPFFSPDSAWVGFFVGQSLQRVSVTGGHAETIITGVRHYGLGGASWGDDGTIVYADRVPGSDRIALFQVAASGGNSELLADPDSSRNQFGNYFQPQLLPGSGALLFHGLAPTWDPKLAEILAMDLNSGAQTSLLVNAMNPLYVAETGHLLFMRQGSLMAVGFDPDRLAIEGEPVIVEEDVMQSIGMPNSNSETGAAQVAVSSSGHLAYARGGVFPRRNFTLMRVMLEGEAEPFMSASLKNLEILAMRLSPGGDQLAFCGKIGRGSDIYVYDFVRDVTQRLNTGGFLSWWPEWSPDGEFIAFGSDREDGVQSIYRMAADGSDEQPERLAASDQNQLMFSWSSTGVIAYGQSGDIWVLPPDGEPRPFVTSEGTEIRATFSPDGEWLAYDSRGEVYVKPYPGPGPGVLISGIGSSAPVWSRDGAQLYFLQSKESPQRMVMMVVDMNQGIPSRARSLIDPWPYNFTAPARSYDVLTDGVFIASLPEEMPSNEMHDGELRVVFNFIEVLRQRGAN